MRDETIRTVLLSLAMSMQRCKKSKFRDLHDVGVVAIGDVHCKQTDGTCVAILVVFFGV